MTTDNNKKGLKYLGAFTALIALLSTLQCNEISSPPLDAAVPAPLTVLTPNNDTTYSIGDTMKISWDLNDSISGLLIEFTLDNGKNYYPVDGLFPNSYYVQEGEYRWVIPDSVYSYYRKSTVSDSCKIWIHDYFDPTIGDVSDNLFSVKAK